MDLGCQEIIHFREYDMHSLSDRYRLWFDHERDSNTKMLAMLESIPAANRTGPDYTKALEKAAHIALARKLWFYRLGKLSSPPANLFPAMSVEEMKPLFVEMENEWAAFFATLTDDDLAKPIEYVRQGLKLRYTLEAALTQTNGHAWYHRGQVGMLVAKLGGTFVDTDFVFWHKPEVLGPG